MDDVTDKTFREDILKSQKPVLVEFWSSWCPPCKVMEPTLKQLEEEHPEIKICKVNTDRNQFLTSEYRVQGVPTFVLFNKGQEIGRQVSAKSKNQLAEMIKEVK